MKKSIIILSILALAAGCCKQANNWQTSNINNIMGNDMPWYEQDKLDIQKFLENSEEQIIVTKDPIAAFNFYG